MYLKASENKYIKLNELQKNKINDLEEKTRQFTKKKKS